jgi:hypothetical protein
MVGSWSCRVSSEIHIKAAATGQEDEKDPKRARVVLSQSHEVVGSGYSMMSSATAMVTRAGAGITKPCYPGHE